MPNISSPKRPIRVERRVSPQAYNRIQVELLRMEMLGYSPEAATSIALARVGLWPEAYTETVLIVDPTLTSVVYPFEEKCSED